MRMVTAVCLVALLGCGDEADGPPTRVWGDGQGLTLELGGGYAVGGVPIRGGNGTKAEVFALDCSDQGAILYTVTTFGEGDAPDSMTLRAVMCNGFNTAEDISTISVDYPPITTMGLRDFQLPLRATSVLEVDPEISTENVTLRTQGALLVGRWVEGTAIVSGATPEDPSAGDVTGDMEMELRDEETREMIDTWTQQARFVWGFAGVPIVVDDEAVPLPF
jgi:hypothetical protein